MPPVTGLLLNSVPGHLAGTASGVFNTSRQAGGALAVAVFGALLANQDTFHHGLQISLLIAAVVAFAAAGAASALNTPAGRVRGHARIRHGIPGTPASGCPGLEPQEA
jgi:DHA2 family methylenomycin A resistance protein-like MFS transporter